MVARRIGLVDMLGDKTATFVLQSALARPLVVLPATAAAAKPNVALQSALARRANAVNLAASLPADTSSSTSSLLVGAARGPPAPSHRSGLQRRGPASSSSL